MGVGDARSLKKLDEWPTFGIDAHELLWDTSEPGRATLIVANGGVPTQPERGRAKLDLDQMNSSLVRLDATSGALLGQWRLADPRLSLRHLAWQSAPAGKNPLLSIALQAEHDDAAQKNRAPVLALFDGSMLKPVQTATSLAGYGGAICARQDGWAVGCPRANGVALFGNDGSWRELFALPHACAVATVKDGCWAGGHGEALWTIGDTKAANITLTLSPDTVRLDNHWALMPKSSRKA